MIAVDVERQLGAFHLAARFESDGPITAIFGPSGSGKTSLIRLIAGLDRPGRGRIAVGDRVLVDTSKALFIAPHRRRVGLVFQDSLLFPHLTVRQNIGYGRLFTPRGARRIDPALVIETLGIGPLLSRRPALLSGGERQRVGLARALIASPDLLLMDEPLASLDGARKSDILGLIERLRDTLGVPIVYVSHDTTEVMRLAATVVVLDQGKVAEIGGPADVLPRAVAREGSERRALISVLHCVAGRYDEAYGLTTLSHPAGAILAAGPCLAEGASVRVVVRATDVVIALGEQRGLSVRSALSARVGRLDAIAAAHMAVALELPGGDRLTAIITRLAADELQLVPGRDVKALIKTAALENPL